jgi:PAS domain S-box-containing protein
VVLLAKLLLNPLITEQSPFLLLAGAVMVGAWFGGLGPGLLATALGALVANYFFLEPIGSFTGLSVAFLPLLLFTLQGLLISSLVAALRSAKARAEASEERFRLLVQGVDNYAIFMLDPEGRITSWNEGAERIHGYTAEEILGTHFSVFYPEDDVERGHLEEELRMAAEEGRFEEEGLRVRKDGSRFWASVLITALRDEQGKLRGFSKVMRDITERKEAERKLRENEELHRSVVEQAAENIFLVDVVTKRIIQANATLHRSLGYSTEEVHRLTLYDIVAHDHEDIERNVHRILEGGRHFIGERQYLRKDGSLIDVEVGASAISYGGREIMCIVAHDITERKRAEEALKESEERFRATFEQAAVGVAHVGADGRWLRVNNRLCEITGYPREELLEMTFQDITHPDDLQKDLDHLRQLLAGELRIYSTEKRYLRKDSSVVWINLTVSAVVDTSGQMKYFIAVVEDVTERKKAEEALRRSLNALLMLYETGQLVSSSLKREEIGSRLLEIIGRISDTTAAVIHLSDDGKRLHAWRAIGPESLLASVRNEPEARAARQVAFEAKEERLLEMEGLDLQEKRFAGVFLPLRVRDRVIGVLEIYGLKHLAESGAVETFASLANQAASALENAQLYEEIAEHRRRLQDLVGKLVMAQEEERRRVAYEVHDGLAQVAAAAYQHLQNFAADNPPSSTRGEDELDQALGMLQHTVEEARNVVADLRPTVLDDFGLATALRLQVERLSGEGLRASYEESLGRERLPEVVETALFRVAQEALTNVRRHARTDRAHVSLERRGQAVRLQVRDWGQGFVADGVTGGTGPGEKVGLHSMRERVALLGGHFEIHSKPGAGTVVVAEVPLQEETDTEGARDDQE